MLSILDMLKIGLAFHRQGRFDDAAFAYRQILKNDSKNPDAHHLLGLVAHYQGRSDIASMLIREAICLAPDVAEYYTNLGMVLLDNGRLNDARLNTQRSLRIDPNSSDAKSNLSIINRDSQRLNVAIETMIEGNRKSRINIYIKCHSRLAQLDRCITSIKLKVSGFHSIIVLNDGIGSPYIDRIRKKHPDVEIRNSDKIARGVISAHHRKKLNFENVSQDMSLDPSRFWVNEIKMDSNKHFLLIEEDCWFNTSVDLADIKFHDGFNEAFIIRLFFNVNARPDNSTGDVYITTSRLLEQDVEIYGKNNQIFSVANSIFQTDFWLYAYSNLRGWADEHKARRHVCEYLIGCMERGIPVRAGSSGTQVINQSNSSTVRQDSGGLAVEAKIDTVLYNEVINELWFRDEFDCMENFPNDFSDEYLINCFMKRLKKEEIQEWLLWKKNYVQMYG
jgi:tetratricopeptide (TPR) repeat protein